MNNTDPDERFLTQRHLFHIEPTEPLPDVRASRQDAEAILTILYGSRVSLGSGSFLDRMEGLAALQAAAQEFMRHVDTVGDLCKKLYNDNPTNPCSGPLLTLINAIPSLLRVSGLQQIDPITLDCIHRALSRGHQSLHDWISYFLSRKPYWLKEGHPYGPIPAVIERLAQAWGIAYKPG